MKQLTTFFCIALFTQLFAQTTITLNQAKVNNGNYFYNNSPYSGIIIKIENNQMTEKFSVQEGKQNGQFIEYYFDAQFKKENFRDTSLINSLSNSIQNLNSDIPKLINDTINSWNSLSKYLDEEIGGAKKFEKLNEKFNSQKLKGEQLDLWNKYNVLKGQHNSSKQLLAKTNADIDKKEITLKDEIHKIEYIPQIKLKGAFINGLKEGNWEYFNVVTDKVYKEVIYKNNKLNGLSRVFYDNGQIKEEVTYVNDEISGLVKNYFDNGKLSKLYTLENNLLSKTFTEYNVNGNKKQESNYLNGKLEGPFTSFFENGKIQSTGSYNNGLMNGPWKYYFSNGNLLGTGSFKLGSGGDVSSMGVPRDNRDGKWQFFYENGKLKEETNWQNGYIIDTKQFYTNGNVKLIGTGAEKEKGSFLITKKFNEDGSPWVSVWKEETDKYTNRTSVYTEQVGWPYSSTRLEIEYSKKSNRFVWRIGKGQYIYGGVGMRNGNLPNVCTFYITINGVKQEEYMTYGNPVIIPDSVLEKLKLASEVAIKFPQDPTYYEFKLNGFEDAIEWLKNK
jgi:antitoxin component YwqK of YwqJK toxin-antitoxin module